MISPNTRRSRRAGLGYVCAAVLMAVRAPAQDSPAWWQTRGVLTADAANDHAALNMGQLKHIAFAAWLELEALPGGAGFQPTFTNAANNYAAVNVGQLKETARPFYGRLGQPCPWEEGAADHALANVGQAKYLFSLDPHKDTDSDGMPDWWEQQIADANATDAIVSIAGVLPGDDFDGDGLTNLQEYQQGTEPANEDTDGDGLTDGDEAAGSEIVEWGEPYAGPNAVARPAGLLNVKEVAAGLFHAVAVSADGTVACWGNNTDGRCAAPSGLTNAVAVAAGAEHSVALRADGTVVCWGANWSGQTNAPPDLTDVVAVAAGFEHTVALRADGTVVCWGLNWEGQTNAPPDLTNAVAVAAGAGHSVALRADGTAVCWGRGDEGQTSVPQNLGIVSLIGAGGYHTLACTGTRDVVCWGDNGSGQSDGRSFTNAPVRYLGGGVTYSLALVGKASTLTDPLNPDTDGDGISDAEDETPFTPGPAITIESPQEGVVLTNSPVTVSGVVSFDGVLDSVRVRGALAAAYDQGSGSYAFTYDLPLDEGSHEIEVRAMGVGAPPPESRKVVTVTVDALPPDVIILSPANGQSFAGANVRATVWTDASNDVVTVNNTATARDGNIRYAWVRLPSAGTGIAIQAVAVDSRNRVGTDTVTVACTDDTYTDPGDDDNDGVPNGEDPAPNDPAVRSTVVITDPPNGITIYSN